ncbi:uncharacterized protein METZ01_LOCUS204595, partial [marine metagenome]
HAGGRGFDPRPLRHYKEAQHTGIYFLLHLNKKNLKRK